MRHKKKVILGILLLLFILSLVAVNIMARSKFAAAPQPLAEVREFPETRLSKSAAHLLGNSATPASTLFTPLRDPHLALIARIELADAAEKTLDLQYYLFHDDSSGRALLAAAVAAARRGVAVRILLDDMDTAGREAKFARLTEELPNLQLRVFNPVYTRSLRIIDYMARFPRSSRRMHNKSFNADNISAIVGGRNVGGEYFGVTTETVFADYDILCAGEVAREVVKEFNQYWSSGIAFDVTYLSDPAGDDDYAAWMAALDKDLEQYRKAMAKLESTAVSELLAGQLGAYYGGGVVIHDDPQKVASSLFDQSGWLAPKVIEIMSSATKDLIIVSPYFIPGDDGVAMFRKLAESGVNVTILTNSIRANDVIAVHAGYIDYRKDLLAAGIQLYELKPTSTSLEKARWALMGTKKLGLHAKTFTVDQQRSFVGSFNLDPRSAMHNTEMGVVFDNAEYGRSVHQFFVEKLTEAAYKVKLTESGNVNWIEQVAEGGTTKEVVHETEPNTGFLLRGVVYALSWLPVEWLM